MHPVADVGAADNAEINVGSQDIPEKRLAVDQLKAGATWLHFECMNPAAGGRASEIDHEQMLVPTVGHSRAGVIRHAAWPSANVSDRRDDIRGIEPRLYLP